VTIFNVTVINVAITIIKIMVVSIVFDNCIPSDAQAPVTAPKQKQTDIIIIIVSVFILL
jgi:hypothetical protein